MDFFHWVVDTAGVIVITFFAIFAVIGLVLLAAKGWGLIDREGPRDDDR
jgi:UPF0716 family protein affecting phage T7 exclusion